MNLKDRIVQAFLYEAIALTVVSPTYALLAGKSFEDSFSLLVAFSIIALTWAFCYNWVFDLCMQRLGEVEGERGQLMRLVHALGLESTMTAMTLPLAMSWMGYNLVEGLISSMGLTAAYCVYGYVFFQGYDLVRKRLKVDQEEGLECSF